MADESDLTLRIFCSVDLIGSTAAKATRPDDISPAWAKHFSDFYIEFPQLLDSAYDGLPTKLETPKIKFRIWKFVGDEILFFAELTDYRETLSHSWAVKEAVTRFAEQWREKTGWKLKATAWLGGFPVLNKEVKLKTDSSTVRDFIGPSIDAGFRIAKFSDARRFAVSVGLAVMLLEALHHSKVSDECTLLFGGREELKGVIQGKPYPIVWIDMLNGKPTIEEKLLGIKYKPDHTSLASFLDGFVDETQDLHRPFISKDVGERFNVVPKKFKLALDSIREPIESSERSYAPGTQDETETSPTKIDDPKIKPPSDPDE